MDNARDASLMSAVIFPNAFMSPAWYSPSIIVFEISPFHSCLHLGPHRILHLPLGLFVATSIALLLRLFPLGHEQLPRWRRIRRGASSKKCYA